MKWERDSVYVCMYVCEKEQRDQHHQDLWFLMFTDPEPGLSFLVPAQKGKKQEEEGGGSERRGEREKK